jgi:hypothetical protein
MGQRVLPSKKKFRRPEISNDAMRILIRNEKFCFHDKKLIGKARR